MKRLVTIASLLLVVPLLLAARQASSPSVPSYFDDAFERGETIDYSLSWLKVVGGSAQLTIGPNDTGASKRYRISIVARSAAVFNRIYPVRDEIESIVDAKSFSTVRFHKILNERSKSKEELTIVDEKRGVAMRKGNEFTFTPPVFDPLSIIMHLRRLDLSPGKVYRFNVLADGKVYPMEVNVTGREVVSTEAGVFRTVIVEPKMAAGGIFRDENSRLQIWYSDDSRRIPVRIRSDIKHGTITALVRKIQVGVPK